MKREQCSIDRLRAPIPADVRLEAEREVMMLFPLLERTQIAHCIIAPPTGEDIFSAHDIDLYISPEGRRVASDYLVSREWKALACPFFPDKREYFQKLVSGWRIQIDIIYILGVISTRELYTFKANPEFITDERGLIFLSPYSYGVLQIMKAELKGVLSEEKRDLLEAYTRADPRLADLWCRAAEVGNVRVKPNKTVKDMFERQRATLFADVRRYLSKYRSVSLRRGDLTIAVVGLDGSGKTSTVLNLVMELQKRGVTVSAIYLGYSNLQLSFVQTIQNAQSRSKGWCASFLRLMLFFGYIIEFTYRRGLGRRDVLITDRHPLVEPLGTNLITRLLTSWLLKLVPAPDIVIHLSGDLAQLWARKKEVTYEDFCRQAARLQSCLDDCRRKVKVFSVCTDDSSRLDDTVGSIMETIRPYLNARC